MISSNVRADAIARTESMRALNQGTLLSYQQYGIEYVEIPPSGTEGDWNCDCQDLVEGGPYRIEEAPELPAHPNCTHTYRPSSPPNDTPEDPDSYYNLATGEETTV